MLEEGDIKWMDEWLGTAKYLEKTGAVWSRIKKTLEESAKTDNSQRVVICPLCKSEVFYADDGSGCCKNVDCDFEFRANNTH